MKNHYIYRIANKIDGKFYIGARSFNGDIYEDNYMGSGTHLKHAQKKYGIEFFKKDILCVCESRKQLYEYERLLVPQELVDDENCYNLKIGGEGGSKKGIKHTAEAKAKMSAAKKNTTAETRAKMSAAKKNISKETRTKLSVAAKGNTNALGLKHTEETRTKISAAAKNISKETRAKMSAAGKERQKYACPHCDVKPMGMCNLKQHHLDNCKEKT